MDLREEPYIQAMIRLCLDGWSQGWHERNAGNLSYRLTAEEAGAVCASRPKGGCEDGPWRELEVEHPALEGQCIAITASGSYFRNAADDPNAGMGVVFFGEEGRAFRVVAGFQNGAKPSSELAAHAAAHEALMGCAPEKRVLYHAHAPAMASVTNVLEPNSKTVTRALWCTMIECMTIFPQGIGVVPPMIPGTQKIAEVTAGLLRNHDLVVWSHHGMLCPGASFDEAFGLAHMVEKAARIWCDAAAAAGSPALVRGVSQELLEAISQSYGLKANPSYLER